MPNLGKILPNLGKILPNLGISGAETVENIQFPGLPKHERRRSRVRGALARPL